MDTVSIMEAQHNLAKVLRQVEAGKPVGITRRKQLIAELRPVAAKGTVDIPDFEGRARRTWGEAWSGTSSEDLLAESRGSR